MLSGVAELPDWSIIYANLSNDNGIILIREAQAWVLLSIFWIHEVGNGVSIQTYTEQAACEFIN